MTTSSPSLFAHHRPFSPQKRAEVAQFWAENGFFVLESALSTEEILGLRAEAVRRGLSFGRKPKVAGEDDVSRFETANAAASK